MKYIGLCMGLLLSAAACQTNQIDLYESEPRLELGATGTYEFTDVDFLNGNTEIEGTATVNLIGYPLTAPLTYALTCVETDGKTELPRIAFEEVYTFPMDTMSTTATFKVGVPEGLQWDYTTTKWHTTGKLVFDLNNPGFQFEAGREENLTCNIEVRMNLDQRRWTWNTGVWGIYSASKYAFMIRHFGETYEHIAETPENVKEVAEAYKLYRHLQPPLLDDGNPAMEIFFPTNN